MFLEPVSLTEVFQFVFYNLVPSLQRRGIGSSVVEFSPPKSAEEMSPMSSLCLHLVRLLGSLLNMWSQTHISKEYDSFCVGNLYTYWKSIHIYTIPSGEEDTFQEKLVMS